MTRFSFLARNMKGEVVKDTLDATSTQEARALLVERGLLVEELNELQEPQPTLDSLSTPSAFPAWTTVDDQVPATVKSVTENNQKTAQTEAPSIYFPFMDTLRLYAGWLIAWYLGIYALGYYQQSRGLPFAFEYIENLYRSPLVLSFTLGAFLFLLVSTVHRALGRGRFLGFALILLSIGIFLLYRKNVG